MDATWNPYPAIEAGEGCRSMDARRLLDRLALVHRYHRGQEIPCQDASGDCWCRLIGGAAMRCTLHSDGRRQIADFLLPGDFFLMSPRTRDGYFIQAVAEDTRILCYNVSRVEMLAGYDARIGRELLAMMAAAIKRLQAQIAIMGRESAVQKVGFFLLAMIERAGNESMIDIDVQLDLPMSRYEIADYLCLSVETVSRCLTRLKRCGAIKFAGPRRVRIANLRALTDYCKHKSLPRSRGAGLARRDDPRWFVRHPKSPPPRSAAIP